MTPSVPFLTICYYGRQWDLIWCDDASSGACLPTDFQGDAI